MSDSHTLARWRLVLGQGAEQHNIDCSGDAQCQRIEELVGFLFDKPEEGKDGPRRGRSKDRRGGQGG